MNNESAGDRNMKQGWGYGGVENRPQHSLRLQCPLYKVILGARSLGRQFGVVSPLYEMEYVKYVFMKFVCCDQMPSL